MYKINEIFETVIERFRNPLLFAFAISWVIINFKFFVVLFADITYLSKFEYIDTVLYPKSYDTTYKLFILPMLLAIAYIFLLPIASLGSTWAQGFFENLHNIVRAKALRKAILTAEQRDTLRRETTSLLNKLQREVQDAKTSSLDLSNRTTKRVEDFVKTILPMIFKLTEIDASGWQSVTKPPSDRNINGTAAQEQFIVKHGIPNKWIELFDKLNTIDHLTANLAAKHLDITEYEALNILLKLSSLGMIEFKWHDDTPHFHFIDSRWLALLNGRPA